MNAKKEDLDGFFAPSSIAIIGASPDEKKVGGILLKKAIESKAEIIPVCGNGTVESSEQCDDGNLRSWDGCSSKCTKERIYRRWWR